MAGAATIGVVFLECPRCAASHAMQSRLQLLERTLSWAIQPTQQALVEILDRSLN